MSLFETSTESLVACTGKKTITWSFIKLFFYDQLGMDQYL